MNTRKKNKSPIKGKKKKMDLSTVQEESKLSRWNNDIYTAVKNMKSKIYEGDLLATDILELKCSADTNPLDAEVFNSLSNQLPIFSNWKKISNWFLNYEYYMEEDSFLTASYEYKIPITTRLNRKLVWEVPVILKVSENARDGIRQHMPHLAGYSIKKLLSEEEFTFYRHVSISIKKVFCYFSQSCQTVFRFELIQKWPKCDTIHDAEKNLLTQSPTYHFSIFAEVDNQNKHRPLIFDVLFFSLLIKILDIFRFPHDSRCSQVRI